MEREVEVDRLRKDAKRRVQDIFIRNGLSKDKRLGLQRELRDALINAAVNGIIKEQ